MMHPNMSSNEPTPEYAKHTTSICSVKVKISQHIPNASICQHHLEDYNSFLGVDKDLLVKEITTNNSP